MTSLTIQVIDVSSEKETLLISQKLDVQNQLDTLQSSLAKVKYFQLI